MEKKILITIIQELCEEMNIKMEKLSYGWILQLSKDGKVRHILDYLFDNNSIASGKIAADKYATYEVLQSQNIPIIQYTMIFNPSLRGELIPKEGIWNTVATEFSKYGKLVVKPNDGSTGKGIKLCQTLREVEIAIHNLFNEQHKSVSICPYYDIQTEFRTFFLNGEILCIYKKIKPFVIGDGKTRLKELIEELDLPNKDVREENLHRLDLNYVPKEDEKMEISWKHNLSGGATPKILQKGELYKKVEQLAIQAGKAMNMNFTTIDIIQTVDDKLYVMEMNSGVCGDIFAQSVEGGYEIMKEIYRKALKAMFE
ncbi:MAG: hypothetical protein HFJ34_00245 [Clostridia bacterium]|nr:hypothetical protein [Clostridia bacterium]